MNNISEEINTTNNYDEILCVCGMNCMNHTNDFIECDFLDNCIGNRFYHKNCVIANSSVYFVCMECNLQSMITTHNNNNNQNKIILFYLIIQLNNIKYFIEVILCNQIRDNYYALIVPGLFIN